MKHTPLLQEILHVEGLHENAAQRLHKTMKGDAAGVTFENLVIFMASVVKVSCRGPMMTHLGTTLRFQKESTATGSQPVFKLGLMHICTRS